MRPRVLVIGSGWAGFHVARHADKARLDVRVVSPANHFLFTPLLPSTAVGTLEFRCIQEPVRTIPKLAGYYQSKVTNIDFQERSVTCTDIFKGDTFSLPYDYLVLAPGCKTNTMDCPGVEDGEEVMFLKHLYHARRIRNRILECFERASQPNCPDEKRNRLLSFVVVGGGPTNCEFTGELHDFIKHDVTRWYPDLRPHVQVTMVEASDHVLGSFDRSLATYVEQVFAKRDINVRLNTVVREVRSKQGPEGLRSTPVEAVLGDGSVLPFGMMVWSAGLKQVKLVENLNLDKDPSGRLVVDDYLRVPGLGGRVFAMGDCAVNIDKPLAPLAKVAQQQGKYLANNLNQVCTSSFDTQVEASEPFAKKFKYFDLGSMVQIGGWQGAVDLSHVKKKRCGTNVGPVITGISAQLAWRSAYWGMQVSLVNKILIPMHWFKSWLFGRDISRF